jgi:hypothetical protein
MKELPRISQENISRKKPGANIGLTEHCKRKVN